jgi:hypothetical protein
MVIYERKASKFIGVHAIHNLPLGDELLVYYKFHRPPTAHQRRLTFELLLDIPLGHKKKIIE